MESMKSKEAEEAAVVCGGEEHEEPELIHPCPCDGGSTLAVGNTGLWGCSKQSSAVDACLMCAARGSQPGKGKPATRLGSKKGLAEDTQSRSTRRHVKSDQSCKGVKRLRSALTNGGVAPRGEGVDLQQSRMDKQDTDVNMDDKGLRPVTSSVADPSKADVPALGRRFSDVAASVPIKKRRLLNMEVARSPSPPRRPILKQDGLEPVADNKPQGQVIEDSEMAEGGVAEEDGRHASPASKEQRDCVDSCAGTGLMEKVFSEGEVHQASHNVAVLRNPGAVADLKKEGQVVLRLDPSVGSIGSEVGVQLNAAGVSDLVDDKRHEQEMGDGVGHLQSQVASEDVRRGNIEQLQPEVLLSSKQTEVDLGSLDTREALEGGDKPVHLENNVALPTQLSPLLGGELQPVTAVYEMPAASDRKRGTKSDILTDLMTVEERRDMAKRAVEEGTSGGDIGGPSNGHVDVRSSHVCEEKGGLRDIDRSSSRDVRLHWDLNMDMEEWERPTEDGGAVASSSRQPELDSNGSRNRQSQSGQVQPTLKVDTSSSLAAAKQTGSEALPYPERDSGAEIQQVDTGEYIEYDEPDFDEEEELVGEDKSVLGSMSEKAVEKSQVVAEGAAKVAEAWDASGEEFEAEHVDYDDSDNNDVGPESDERTSVAHQAESQFRADELLGSAGEGSEPKSLRKLKPTVGENGARAAHDGSFRDSAFKDLKPTHPRLGAVTEVAADDRQLFSEPNRSIVQGASTGAGRIAVDRIGKSLESGLHGDAVDRKLRDTGSKREDKWSQGNRDVPGTGAGYVHVQRPEPPRTKSTGWDQLPEGFENPADALRAVKDPGRAGRASLWSGPAGRGSTSGGVVSSRFTAGAGRALPTRMESIGDRVRLDDGPWGRDDGTRGRRVEESLDMSPRISSPREIGRGRSRGRGGSPASGRGRGGRGDAWLDPPNGPGPWGPNRHPSPPGRYEMGFGPGPRGPPNAAAMAAAKVESSGFVVAPDGTITKAESPGGSSMRGGRVGRGVGPGMLSMGRGPGMGMGVGPGMGVGMRVGMGLGRGMGMGPGMGMNVGIGMGMGMGVGPGVGMGMPGRGGPGGRGRAMMDSFSGPPYSRGMPPFTGSSNRGGGEEYSDNGWMRRERSLSPARPHGRRSPTIHSPRGGTRSKSRTRSRTPPRLRTPPRQSNSGGSGGPVAGRKRSRSPGIVTQRLEVRGLEPVSPARRSVPPPPKLPLPPPPPRNQRSPPAGLKRLSDKQREGDRSRERERPIGRVRSPPRRTSPHVVHGSSLMDERDRALLAGIRHISPPAVRHRPDGATGSVVGGQEAGSPGPGPTVIAADGRTPVENSVMVGVKKEEQVGLRLDRNREGIRAVHERDRDRRLDSGPRRDSGKDEDRLKVSHAGRPGPVGGSFKLSYASSREGDDDVAPRRRRPSP